MRFTTRLTTANVKPLLNQLIEITGQEPWRRKFEALARQRTENWLLRDYQRERHGIEIGFNELLEEYRTTRVLPLTIRDQLQYCLYAFGVPTVQIYQSLSAAGRRRLRGMLLDGLKPDNNLLSLQHEIMTAVWLVDSGFDVEFNDIENGSGVDFIASREGLELEVECKMVTGDLCRKIHKRKVLMLYRYLLDTLTQICQSAKTGMVIRITVPDRLNCQPAQLDGIARAVAIGVLNGTATTKTPHGIVEALEFPIPGSPFDTDTVAEITRESIENFIYTQSGRENINLLPVFYPRKFAVVVLIESAKPDDVLKGISRALREACKKQFSQTRPGHLAVQFQDPTAKQMEDLARDDASGFGKASALQTMTSDLLLSRDRTHIHSVSYRSSAELLPLSGQPNTVAEQGCGSFTINPLNPYSADPRLRPLYAKTS